MLRKRLLAQTHEVRTRQFPQPPAATLSENTLVRLPISHRRTHHIQRSEQTISFSRVLRKFLAGSLLDVVTDREMRFVQGYRAHAVEVFAEVPGSIVDFPIRESPQGDFQLPSFQFHIARSLDNHR